MEDEIDALLEHLGVPLWTTRPDGTTVLRKNLAEEIEADLSGEYREVLDVIEAEVTDNKSKLAQRIRLVLEGKTS